MKVFVITLLVSVAMFFSGLYIGAKYIGQGEVVVALCGMGEVAIKEDYLSEYQFLELSEKTGRMIGDGFPMLAENISLSEDESDRVADGSSCSQILLAFTNGVKYR